MPFSFFIFIFFSFGSFCQLREPYTCTEIVLQFGGFLLFSQSGAPKSRVLQTLVLCETVIQEQSRERESAVFQSFVYFVNASPKVKF